MQVARFAEMLDLHSEDPLRNATGDELTEFIEMAARFLELDMLEARRYLAQDLRTRVIQHFVPAKILRQKGLDTSRLIRGDIALMVEDILGPEAVPEQRDVLVEMIHRHARAVPEVRSTRIPSVEELLAEYPSCRICGFRFRGENPSARADSYDCLKPSSKKPSLRRPEVEHWLCVGRFGTNNRANLCLCCKQCNGGKQDHISYAETRSSSGYRRNDFLVRDNNKMELVLLYSVLMRDGGCVRCRRASHEVELTLAPRRQDRLYFYDNLVTVCYDCDDYAGRWKPR